MNRNAVIKIVILLAVILICVFLFFHFDLYRFFVSKKKIIHFVSSFGPLSVVIFISLQIVQVLVAPIPGEITGFVGGYIYGPILGTLYSTAGLTIGSWFAFLLARWLGLPFVEKIIKPQVIQKYDHFMEHRGIPITFILFLIPGFPKDALSYIIGLSHMRSATFLILCTAGRLLGTIMLSVSGHYARNDQNTAMLAILGISALVTLAAWYYHDDILHLVRRHNKHKDKKRVSAPGDHGEEPIDL
ncbi:MAG: TVP38/TMEM64 family protein [Deltaproteobacteria bacterium]|nr:TVP38/TMEM64 family protein [Deltaproteobacteria bacterium]